MGETVDYNDEAFRAAAERTGGVRDRIKGVLDTLETSINGRGTPWGNDEIGQNFANGESNNGYTASRENLITSAENIAGTMDSFYRGQVKSADFLEDMEDGNRDGMR